MSLARMHAGHLGRRNYEAAFLESLNTGSPETTMWLCKQIQPDAVFDMEPCPLSQVGGRRQRGPFTRQRSIWTRVLQAGPVSDGTCLLGRPSCCQRGAALPSVLLCTDTPAIYNSPSHPIYAHTYIPQEVLLSLVTHLAHQLTSQETELKLSWLVQAAPAIDPKHPRVAEHCRSVPDRDLTTSDGLDDPSIDPSPGRVREGSSS